MISNDISNTQTVRNVYIIDPEGIIRLILIYPMNVGRCIPEILRALEALQVADKCKGALIYVIDEGESSKCFTNLEKILTFTPRSC